MAYKVISCKLIQRNAQKIRIADFTILILLPCSEMTKNTIVRPKSIPSAHLWGGVQRSPKAPTSIIIQNNFHHITLQHLQIRNAVCFFYIGPKIDKKSKV